ncbi:MAG: prepilin peptidase [Acidimicrobiales bacterium]
MSNQPTINQPTINPTIDHRAVSVATGALTTLAVVAVAVQHRADPLIAGLLSIVVMCYGVLSAVDIAEQHLPNRITLPLAGVTATLVLGSGIASGNVGAALGALAIGLGLAVVFVLLRFGMGDVKLALTVGTIAGWLGRDAVMVTAYVGAISGAVVALLLIIIYRRRDVSFSFGPILAIGSIAGMCAATI